MDRRRNSAATSEADSLPREAIHVAVDDVHGIVGLQVLDLLVADVCTSMAHVGQVGTFLLAAQLAAPAAMGRRLWSATTAFAAGAGYRKLVIQVRGSNSRRAGVLSRPRVRRTAAGCHGQVIIDGIEDDEVP